MENPMMTRIAIKIAEKLDWKEYMGECEKRELIEEVLNEFTRLMTEAIKTVSEE